MIFRKATPNDIDAVAKIYEKIHAAEAAGEFTTGWIRGVYPVRDTAVSAVERGDLFVLDDWDTTERSAEIKDGDISEGAEAKKMEIRGAAVINQIQVDVYENAPWKHEAADDEVCVIHCLVIDPDLKGKGYGREFVRFYERYAKENGMPELRIDTNEINLAARGLYGSLGYEEVSIVPTVFNGIPGINLVMLEKHL